MAVFVWKDQHGDEPPPACTGVFADVPCPGGFAADYIEAIAAEGVTAGCGGGNFCPNASDHQCADGRLPREGLRHLLPAVSAMKRNERNMKPLSTRTFIVGLVVGLAFAASPVFAGTPTVSVTGTVTDASGHGWPLYARIEMTSAATDPVVVYSDPITGAYAANSRTEPRTR